MSLAVAVSPHLDDAVFSCGGLIGRLTQAGWDVEVVTVFTGSVAQPRGFALECQLDKGLPPDADYMELRREEDRVATRMLGASARWFPFLEAPHRGYGSAPALFGTRLAADDVLGPVTDALSGLLSALSPDLVLAPQALGGHVDHCLTVEALRRVRRPSTLWWRDFPYATRSSCPEPFGDVMRAWDECAIVTDLRRKLEACASYRSQIGFQFGGREGLERALEATGGTERLLIEGSFVLP